MVVSLTAYPRKIRKLEIRKIRKIIYTFYGTIKTLFHRLLHCLDSNVCLDSPTFLLNVHALYLYLLVLKYHRFSLFSFIVWPGIVTFFCSFLILKNKLATQQVTASK